MGGGEGGSGVWGAGEEGGGEERREGGTERISTPSDCSVESLAMLDQRYDGRSLAPRYTNLRVVIHEKARTRMTTHGLDANPKANANNTTNNANDNSDAENEV